MKKLSALVLALVLAVSVNVFAETGSIKGDVDVNGTKYKSGDAYSEREAEHVYTEKFTVNGHEFPAGTKWEAVKMADGTWVPVGDKAFAMGGLTATTVGLGVLGVVAIAALTGKGNTITTTTVTP